MQEFRTILSTAKATCPECGRTLYLRKSEIVTIETPIPGVESVSRRWFGCVPCRALMIITSIMREEVYA